MTIDNKDIIILPDDALPGIDELDGDLRLLAEIVGVSLALQIGQFFHGTPVRFGRVKKWVRRHRDRQIRKAYDNGVPVIELARKNYLTDRQIWNILGSPEPDERQLKLW